MSEYSTDQPEYGEQINVLSELDRIGYAYKFSGDAEIRIVCAFHEDTAESPNCCVSLSKRVFNCTSCHTSGTFVSLLAKIGNTTPVVILADLSKRYTGLVEEKTIPAASVDRWASQIQHAKPLVQALHERGVTDQLIARYKLGERDGRVTIPIKSQSGLWVNVRSYLPGAPGKQKMRNAKYRGTPPRLYPIEQLAYQKLVICGGEMKAIVAADQLNKHGIGAISTTGGEGYWDANLTRQFKSKWVAVCGDLDKAGVSGVEKICQHLYKNCAWLGTFTLPLDSDKYPKGDINDFIGREHGELLSIVEAATTYKPQVPQSANDLSDELPEEVYLSEAIHARNAARRVAVKVSVTSVDNAPFIIPSKVGVSCSKGEPYCALCMVQVKDTNTFCVQPENPAILEMMQAPIKEQRLAIMKAIGVPSCCKKSEFAALSYYNIEHAIVSPPMDVVHRNAERISQPAMCIGDRLEVNESYQITGRMYPHPKSQQSTLLISKYETTQDALSTYVCPPETAEQLRVFKTSSDVQSKLDHIYADFEANVTRIYMRRDLHLVCDLMYHSPLYLPFDGRVTKGWVEALVVGDSGHGKSAVSCGTDGQGGLMEHYRLGKKVEAKNASVAGLLGGLQQMGQRWFVTWGEIPNSDRRAVIIEELKGAHPDVFAKLTDMRSSGRAKLEKIEKRETWARTRLLVNSNPRSGRFMDQFNFGVEAIKELIPGLEDIRRFDVSLIVAASEIKASVLNQLNTSRPVVQHTYTSDLCRSLVLWAWTRKPEEIDFTQDAQKLCLDLSTNLSSIFSDSIPIFDTASGKNKLARLSASLAARLFSTDDTGMMLCVLPEHVQYIYEWLKRIYSSPVHGYKAYSESMTTGRTLADGPDVLAALCACPYPREIAISFLNTGSIETVDLQDWCGWTREQAARLLSFLVRKRALTREGRNYKKSGSFINFLKDALETEGKLVELPDHLRQEY